MDILKKLLECHATKENPISCYCTIYGNGVIYPTNTLDGIHFFKENGKFIILSAEGKFNKDGECVIFPSCKDRTWTDADFRIKINTFADVLAHYKKLPLYDISTRSGDKVTIANESTYLEESLRAQIMIHILIQKGYGGNVNPKDLYNSSIKKYMVTIDGEIEYVHIPSSTFVPLAIFYTKEDAKRFAQYADNLNLLRIATLRAYGQKC